VGWASKEGINELHQTKGLETKTSQQNPSANGEAAAEENFNMEE